MKYKKLYESIRQGIETGEYAPGQNLPTESAMSAWGYSRNTVRQALALLEQEGLILKRRGSGSMVKPLRNNRRQAGNVAVMAYSIKQYIFPDTLNGIYEGLRGWGTALLYATNGLVEEERRILTEILEREDIDGVIVEAYNTALPNLNAALYQALIDKGVPVVFLFSYCQGLHSPIYVGTDDIGGGAQAVRYLYEQGHRRLGGVFVPDTLQGQGRYSGFVNACTELKIPLLTQRLLWLPGISLMEPDLVKERIWATAQKCDAFLCDNDYYAIAAVEAVLAAGLRVPEDIAIIGFDNSYLCDLAPVPLTSMDSNPFEMGRSAAKKIKKMLAGKPAASTLHPWTLIQRKSG